MFLAGTAAYLYASRGRTTGELSTFLWTRGLWLILLELTVVRWFGWDLGINVTDSGLAVIWALGASMIALAALVWLPWRVLLAVGVGMIVLHNALDGIRPEQFGSAHWLWRLLHVRGPLPARDGVRHPMGYPLIPWIGVMAAGYCFGRHPGARAGTAAAACWCGWALGSRRPSSSCDGRISTAIRCRGRCSRR